MSTVAKATEIGAPKSGESEIPLSRIEAELTRRLKVVQEDAHAPVQRVRMSNLIIYCSHETQKCQAESLVPEIVAQHPARVLLLLVDPDDSKKGLTASVLVRQLNGDPRHVSEQITLHAGPDSLERLPFAVRGLLIGDLPTNLWWASSTPPPLAGSILGELAEHAEQILFDSLGWKEPNQGVARLSTWLDDFERDASRGRWRIASDVNWRRLKFWRRLLTQGLDPATAPGFLPEISEVVIEHGPHAVTQAWQVASWLSSRLGWTYESSKIEPNVEIAFQFQAPQGPVALRIDRLSKGDPEIRRIKITSGDPKKPHVLEFASEDGDRLSVTPKWGDAAPRTVTVRTQRPAELIARQLSDREPDPVFRESMKVAQQLAGHVIE